jgi:hypothetical protein
MLVAAQGLGRQTAAGRRGARRPHQEPGCAGRCGPGSEPPSCDESSHRLTLALWRQRVANAPRTARARRSNFLGGAGSDQV